MRYVDIKTQIRYSQPVIVVGKTIKHFKHVRKVKRVIAEYMKKSIIDAKQEEMSKYDRKIWTKALLSYSYTSEQEAISIAMHFNSDRIDVVKTGTIPKNTGKNPILMVCVKNDLERVKMLLKHHQKLGIKYFCFLDNGSDDGTFEWLQDQECDLFRTTNKYENAARASWLFKLISFYGFNRWYLELDSDELFVWPSMEKESITELVEKMQKKHLTALGSCMIDMYKDDYIDKVEKQQNMDRDIKSEYCYFDTDSYFVDKEHSINYPHYIGGPRYRIFEKEEGIIPATLTKYPLIFMKPGYLYRYHYMYPYYINRKSLCYSALLHYKFIDGDIAKYKEIVEKGTYAKGSYHYKVYMEKLENEHNITFMYQASAKYIHSEDILKIGIVKEL